MKNVKRIVSLILAFAMLVLLFTACSGVKKADKEYLAKVDEYPFWQNSASQSIPQTNVSSIVEDFLNEPAKDGITKKIAFIGYDGCRSDALINAFGDDDDLDDIDEVKNSAVVNVFKEGGYAYLLHCGGYKGEDTEQATSTAPGWASLLTGVWGVDHGVTDNDDVKNMTYKTLMLRAAEEYGMKSTFAASWKPHFKTTYSKEVDYVSKNSDITMTYEYVDDDEALHEYLLDCLTVGSENEKDFIFGIYEATDHDGHTSTFGNHNDKYIDAFHQEDKMVLELLEKIESRASYSSEDWLIILTTDHGGLGYSHGGQSLEERTTWMLTNKKVDESYYLKGYDGYNILMIN